MRIHNIRFALFLLAAVIAAAVPASASAKTTQKYSTTLSSVPISTANGYPGPGGTAVLVSQIKAKPFGEGAAITRVKITGQPAPNTFKFKGTETDYWVLGTLRNRFTGTATVQTDGSQRISIKGKFTGGSARYRGATGRYSFTGVTPAGSTVTTGRSRGHIRY